MNATPIAAQPGQFSEEDLIKAAHEMRRCGGSFAAHIGGALLAAADKQDAQRLADAFPELIKVFLDQK